MSDKKILLLAGGGYADIPLIQAAQNLGYYVVTTGNRQEELGHTISDEYRPADYSDPEAMLGLAIELNIDAICPCCNDFSAISSAYVAEQLGLPGHDSFASSQLIHHKDSYRKFALDNNIPTPKALGFTDPGKALSSINDFQLPVIIKPVDLTGGKGITTVRDVSHARNALENAFRISKLGRVVIEEFIEGSRHGMSTFINDGKVVFHFTDNEYYFLNPYLVSAASVPTTVSADAVQELVTQANKVVELLELKNGIFHLQFILHNDSPIIIEICRRPPGDLYIKLVKHATGINYPEWIVKAFCGLDCSGLTHKDVTGFYLRHCIMASRPGVLDTIEIAPSIESNIIESVMWWRQGDKIKNHLATKFGIVFLKFDTLSELLIKSDEMQELICASFRKP